MKRIIIITAALLAAVSCMHQSRKDDCSDFTQQELSIIRSADSIMRVLTVRDSLDLAVLRSSSTCLSAASLRSEEYARLASLMVSTVTHPSQDGVGIAGPQVGLNRRVVAVQRFDKDPVIIDGQPVHPFEVYPNIRIVWASDSLASGPEGCLSVPDRRGNVLRSKEIVIEYTDLDAIADESTCKDSKRSDLPVIRDTVSGFTAVIFQHETDHLDGILYTDRLETMKAENASF